MIGIVLFSMIGMNFEVIVVYLNLFIFVVVMVRVIDRGWDGV